MAPTLPLVREERRPKQTATSGSERLEGRPPSVRERSSELAGGSEIDLGALLDRGLDGHTEDRPEVGPSAHVALGHREEPLELGGGGTGGREALGRRTVASATADSAALCARRHATSGVFPLSFSTALAEAHRSSSGAGAAAGRAFFRPWARIALASLHRERATTYVLSSQKSIS